jgi:Alpha-tubulin suppressor and related RCC1 domain-containing proteins
MVLNMMFLYGNVLGAHSVHTVFYVLGAVYGWGKNCFGQLGLSDDQDKLFPSQLKTLRSIRVKYIACGEDFSVFLTKVYNILICHSMRRWHPLRL